MLMWVVLRMLGQKKRGLWETMQIETNMNAMGGNRELSR
jgi:hypothetical protein